MTAGKEFPGVVLVGFMGSGKSSVGREVARRFRAEFVDLDERIERAAGRSIRELFAAEGEPAFREREKVALQEALSMPGRVVATGGGAFMEEWNRKQLKAYAPVVYLEASPEAVLERLSRDSHRPLLCHGDRDRVVRELLVRRLPGYREADHTVSTEGRTVSEVAERVMELLRKTEGRKR